MRLYKDYKEEQEFQKKEEEDRQSLGVPGEITIIYEQTHAAITIKAVTRFLLLVIVLAAMAAGIILLAFYIQ